MLPFFFLETGQQDIDNQVDIVGQLIIFCLYAANSDSLVTPCTRHVGNPTQKPAQALQVYVNRGGAGHPEDCDPQKGKSGLSSLLPPSSLFASCSTRAL